MILRREYLQRVTKKSFWIGTLVFPLLMAGFAFVPMLLMNLGGDEQKTIVLLDDSGRLAEPLTKALAETKLTDGRPKYALEIAPIEGTLDETRKQFEPRVREKKLNGILTAAKDLDADGAIHLYSLKVGDIRALGELQGHVRRSVIAARLESLDLALSDEARKKLMKPVEVESFQVSQEGGDTQKKGFEEAYFGTFAFVLVLYMSLLIYGIAMMRGILEEKSNRIMEVLLGAVTPNELMTGKIFGIGLVGLTQIGIYAATAGALRVWAATRTAGGAWEGTFQIFTLGKLAYFLVFFLLGYFLFTALFAAVGAVCNSEEEAQNLQSPLIMCLVIPMVCTIYFVGNPDSTPAVIASLIPVFTPMVMFMRIMVLTPPFWQIALSIALTAGTIWLLFRAVAKIFRIGVLMYGKRPTIPEILRWARS
jgi:ABC-2 type transport system permease protein